MNLVIIKNLEVENSKPSMRTSMLVIFYHMCTIFIIFCSLMQEGNLSNIETENLDSDDLAELISEIYLSQQAQLAQEPIYPQSEWPKRFEIDIHTSSTQNYSREGLPV